MNNISEYKLLKSEHGDIDGFNEQANKLICSGWEPYGDPFSGKTQGFDEVFQAFVRPQKED